MKFGTEEQTVKQIQKRLVTLSSLWKIVLKENQRKEDCNINVNIVHVMYTLNECLTLCRRDIRISLSQCEAVCV